MSNSKGRIVVTLLLVATIINYVDRQTLSVLAPLLQIKLRISSLEYSYAVNSFLIVYAVMYLLVGRVVDRLGTRNGLGCAVVWWSLIEMLHATVIGLKTLCLYRALLAIGEAAIIPGGVKAVAESFDAKQRGAAVGIFEMGLSVGPLLAPPLVGAISVHYGWRQAFLSTGLLGLMWAVAWFSLYPRPKGSPPSASESFVARRPHAPISWGRLFRSKHVWAIGLARFFADPVWYLFLFWIPKYLSDSQGLSLRSITALAWIPYLASLAGGLTGGLASSWLVQRGFSTIKARQRVMFVSVIFVSSSVLCIYVSRLLSVLVVMCIAAFGLQLWGVSVDTLPTDLFPPERIAQVAGFGGFMGALGGVLFTAGTGYVVQHYSYTSVWVASALMYPIALVLSYLLLRSPSHFVPEITSSTRVCD